MPAIAPEPPVLWHGDVIEIGTFIHGVLQDGLVSRTCIMGPTYLLSMGGRDGADQKAGLSHLLFDN
jgi:hypothetical protein